MGKFMSKMVEGPAGGSAWAKEARQDPELRKFDLEGFTLASGVKLPAGAVLAYRVYGEGPKLAVAGTSYGVTHKQVEYHVGETVDPKVRALRCHRERLRKRSTRSWCSI